jgi:phospholipid transport system substrate-binding protein
MKLEITDRESWFVLVAGFLTFVLAGLVHAEESARLQDPRDVVQNLSDKVIHLVETHRDTYESDPESFHSELYELMEPVVAFSYIARNVMGKRWYSQVSAEQFGQFEKNLTDSLVGTYAKGFFTYNGEKIVVHPAEEDYHKVRRVHVMQEISTNGGIRIMYTIGLNKYGEWKLLNMVVNGINLGVTLNNQFQQAMEKGESLEAVISSWAAEAPVVEEADAKDAQPDDQDVSSDREDV